MGNEEFFNDEIDLIDIFRVLWKRKFFIIGGTLLIILISFIGFEFSPNYYRSKGFLRLSSSDNKMLIPDYKNYSIVFTSKNNLIKYISNISGDKELISFLENKFGRQYRLNEIVNPVYAYSEEEIRKFRVDEALNFVKGVNISLKSDDTEKNEKIISIIADFIKNSIIKQKIDDYIAKTISTAENNINIYSNEILQTKYQINLLKEKKNKILLLSKKFPSFSQSNIIATAGDENSYNYLPPKVQILGIESQIVDLKQSLIVLADSKKIEEKKLAFFRKMKVKVEKEKLTEDILENIVSELKRFIISDKSESYIKKRVYYSILVKIEEFKRMYDSDLKLLSINTSPKIIDKKRLLFLIALLSFLLLSFLALLFDSLKKR